MWAQHSLRLECRYWRKVDRATLGALGCAAHKVRSTDCHGGLRRERRERTWASSLSYTRRLLGGSEKHWMMLWREVLALHLSIWHLKEMSSHSYRLERSGNSEHLFYTIKLPFVFLIWQNKSSKGEVIVLGFVYSCKVCLAQCLVQDEPQWILLNICYLISSLPELWKQLVVSPFYRWENKTWRN